MNQEEFDENEKEKSKRIFDQIIEIYQTLKKMPMAEIKFKYWIPRPKRWSGKRKRKARKR